MFDASAATGSAAIPISATHTFTWTGPDPRPLSCPTSVVTTGALDVNGYVNGALAGVSADTAVVNTTVSTLDGTSVVVDYQQMGSDGVGTATLKLSRLVNSDGDACDDATELTITHTGIFNSDSVGDGWDDCTEYHAGTDPNDPNSHPLPPGAPPIVTVPPDIQMPATGPDGAPVTFAPAPGASDSSGPIPVTCIPPSGSLFPIGTTVVTCTASNGAGTTTKTFRVTVVPLLPSLSRPISRFPGKARMAYR